MLFRDEQAESQDARGSSVSIASTLIVFMAALAMVRWIMPRMVEEVHYGIERGKQRAQYEFASQRLSAGSLSDLSESSQLVSNRIKPSVVHIDTRRAASFTAGEVEPRLLDDSSAEHEVHGQGSGVIVDERGKVLTNYHVIQNTEEIMVTLADDRQSSATVIGVDAASDLALLQLDKSLANVTPATWGDSESLKEGAMVWAVGSPFGLSRSITFGILSAKARRSYEGGQLQEFLQSDAAVSAGNSGGPLVDAQGNVVGINTAIVGPTYQGVSFSIPSNTAQRICAQLVATPPVEQGWLGVRLDKVSADTTTSGVVIAALFHEKSPARQAGIEAGDVITRWGDQHVHSPAQLRRLVEATSVTEKVRVELVRNGEPRTLQVAVGQRPLQF